MKHMTIPIPERMKKFRLWNGFPVHYTVMVEEDGTPNFKSMHEWRRIECFRKNWCHLCGERMQAPYAFIGGPLCVEAHRFVDGPMHQECAEYAAKVCPFLSSPTGKYSPIKPGQVVDLNVLNVRPKKMAIAYVNCYTVMRNAGRFGDGEGPHATNPKAPGQIVCVVGEYVDIDWDIMPKGE